MTNHATFATHGPKGFTVTHDRKSKLYRVVFPPNQPVIYQYNAERATFASTPYYNHVLFDHFTIHLIHVLATIPTETTETFTMP